jgi:hypothetical protein
LYDARYHNLGAATRDALALVGFVAACLGAAFVGSAFTGPCTGTVRKPVQALLHTSELAARTGLEGAVPGDGPCWVAGATSRE